MDPRNQEVKAFFNDLSKTITLETLEPKSKLFVKQRLGVVIQRGTFEKEEEIFYLM